MVRSVESHELFLTMCASANEAMSHAQLRPLCKKLIPPDLPLPTCSPNELGKRHR